MELGLEIGKDPGELAQPVAAMAVKTVGDHIGRKAEKPGPGQDQPVGSRLLDDLFEDHRLGFVGRGRAPKLARRVAQERAVARGCGHRDALFGKPGPVLQEAADQPVLVGAMGTQVVDDTHRA